MKTVNINLLIANRSFSLTVPTEQEAIYRKASTMINERIMRYTDKYGDNDEVSYMSMVLLEFAVRVAKEENVDNKLQDLINKIDKTINL